MNIEKVSKELTEALDNEKKAEMKLLQLQKEQKHFPETDEYKVAGKEWRKSVRIRRKITKIAKQLVA